MIKTVNFIFSVFYHSFLKTYISLHQKYGIEKENYSNSHNHSKSYKMPKN